MEPFDYSGHDLVVCGDIHGEFRAIVHKTGQMGITNSVIIVAGDCGLGFYEYRYYKGLFCPLDRKLSRMNNVLLLVRGNHDDPSYFSGRKIDLPCIKSVPDYSVILARGRTVLCVGGAVSQDRSHRQLVMEMEPRFGDPAHPRIWWPDEWPKFHRGKLQEITDRRHLIDTVVSHTPTSYAFHYTISGIGHWLKDDPALYNDVMKEKDIVTSIEEWLIKKNHPLRRWFHGHLHRSESSHYGSMTYRSLAIGELYLDTGRNLPFVGLFQPQCSPEPLAVGNTVD